MVRFLHFFGFIVQDEFDTKTAGHPSSRTLQMATSRRKVFDGISFNVIRFLEEHEGCHFSKEKSLKCV